MLDSNVYIGFPFHQMSIQIKYYQFSIKQRSKRHVYTISRLYQRRGNSLTSNFNTSEVKEHSESSMESKL